MKVGCLLIHGWTGTSFEMEPLVAPLEEIGCEVKLVTLPGHDDTFEAFMGTYFEDWVRGAEEAYIELEKQVDKVVVCGLSMGGTISLELATRYNVLGVVTIASPVYVYKLFPPQMKDWRLPLVRLLRFVRPVWPGVKRSEEVNAIAPWRGYDDKTSLPQLWSLICGARSVGRKLHNVTTPLLAIHCPTDRTAPAGNAWEIAKSVSSSTRRVELVPIEHTTHGHHMLTTHRDTKVKVAQLVVDFVRELQKCEQIC